MTKTNELEQQQIARIRELFDIAGERCQQAGGHFRKAVNCNEWLTEEEQQEFIEISDRLVADEAIANYLERQGTWATALCHF